MEPNQRDSLISKRFLSKSDIVLRLVPVLNAQGLTSNIMRINPSLKPADLTAQVNRVMGVAAEKVRRLHGRWRPEMGAPVFTAAGRYTARGWTEWTQGFQFGAAILLFDATGESDLLEIGRRRTVDAMTPHVSHLGVHDHGFNNVSTYGNLRRLMLEGKISSNEWELRYYEMALRVSGAVQAARWTPTADGGGYICSFNGPHSLFIDTMRTLRSLALSHQLGHLLMGENDLRIGLLDRLVEHAMTTAQHLIFRGESGQTYDVRGRTAHEGLFNVNDGNFRSRSTQQGYSPFSTWTRGLAWAMLGFAEQLEFLRSLGQSKFEAAHQRHSFADMISVFENVCRATCDHYLHDCSAADGIVYWDDGAPGLSKLPGWRERDADPFNDLEPVDSSAAAIAAQGLLRFGNYLGSGGETYNAAAIGIAKRLFSDPYLSVSAEHEGLLLHSVYHRPNGWDHVPPGRSIPCGESSMWGDYHLIELALMIQRIAAGERYYQFFDAAR